PLAPTAAQLGGRCLVGTDPDPAAAFDAARDDAELGADTDQGLLEAADVCDDVDGGGELDDRVPDDLTGTVPGDPAAAVDVDHGGAIERPISGMGAPARGVDRRVL